MTGGADTSVLPERELDSRCRGHTTELLRDIVECLVVAMVFAAAAFAFQAFLQNTNFATTNGLYKSIDVAQWKRDPSWDRVDFSNFLYFPIQGLFCRFLDFTGIYPGQSWRQVALINPLFGALGAGASYLFVKRWHSDRLLAAFSTLFYCGCAFYILLSIISEDDMPNSVLILVATLLACALFPRITTARIVAVATIFSAAWLWEWRVVFPSLPPLVLATFLAPGRWWQRLTRPIIFLASMGILPIAITVLHTPPNVAEAKDFLFRLFWTGKGVETGWAGWSLVKILNYWNGLFESVLGGRNLSEGPLLWNWQIWREAAVASVVLLVLSIYVSIYAWRRCRDPSVFIPFVVLAGTFVAGSIFNLYSQPQDPQMVINIMMWTLPAATIVFYRVSPPCQRGVARRLALAALAVAPIGYNTAQLFEYRGGDSRSMAAIGRLEARFDPKTTVYLYEGFDGIMTWHLVMQGGAYDRTDELPMASLAKSDFKEISAVTATILQPQLSARKVAEVWQGQVERVMSKGYRVVAAPSMLTSDANWRPAFSVIAKPDVGDAIRETFRKSFEVEEVYRDREMGSYYSVRRRQK